ncbi:efflux RND transporter periplasmic adaptor subunit [Candidatus Pandoraea novymonadis]|uniref:Multidrug resistance protein MexA n=1 Tax=Candidatus Pandoraea novymonadis TaxID=1808959 RepID=A0ABX5FDP7_9BURK|nr:efflux RND transporter periplasmic adaptor subunit [Candidatus Pandoraea novymonadis]PSB91799.1 Multidrug resistance protein MexA [Candidatus Pandoraea novymonadis]
MHAKKSSSLSWIVAALVTITFVACGKKSEMSRQTTLPPEVGVVTLQSESVMLRTNLPGRILPFRVADVRARVSGTVLKRDFIEGSDVKQGQRLYKIDPATYQVAYNSAKALLAKAEANAASTRLLEQRYKELVAVEAVSKQEYANAVASNLQAEADVAAARAAVETTRINLNYTDVPAPISGCTGLSKITEGAYVQASTATLMTTIQQIDPVYVNVSQSTTDVLRLRREFAEGRLKNTDPNVAKVTLTLEDGTEYPLAGKLQFSDITVDSTTGSITARAIFQNPRRELLPGMFVHASLEEGVSEKALLVPQQAVMRDQKGNAIAMIVNADGKVETRKLITDRAIGDKWLVTSGLASGDKVIVTGFQKLRMGSLAKPVEINLPIETLK